MAIITFADTIVTVRVGGACIRASICPQCNKVLSTSFFTIHLTVSANSVAIETAIAASVTLLSGSFLRLKTITRVFIDSLCAFAATASSALQSGPSGARFAFIRIVIVARTPSTLLLVNFHFAAITGIVIGVHPALLTLTFACVSDAA